MNSHVVDAVNCSSNGKVFLVLFHLSADFVLPMKVPVRPIISALHKCSLNETREQWDLLWLILILAVADTSGWHWWVPEWHHPHFSCHPVLSQGVKSICKKLFTPGAFLWVFFGLFSSRQSGTIEPITAPFEQSKLLYYYSWIYMYCQSVCIKHSFADKLHLFTQFVSFFPTGPCWHWAAV